MNRSPGLIRSIMKKKNILTARSNDSEVKKIFNRTYKLLLQGNSKTRKVDKIMLWRCAELITKDQLEKNQKKEFPVVPKKRK